MENENKMCLDDAKRKSFNKGWNSAIKKAEQWMIKKGYDVNDFIKFMKDQNE